MFKNQGNKKTGLGCAILFLLPFAAVGVFMTGWTVLTVYDYARMSQWVEVPATLTHLEQTRGDDTTGVNAEFVYEYAGRQYSGDRVAIHEGNDNIGGFQGRLYKRLDEAKRKNRQVTCFVNPSDPSEAILNRNLRPEMLAFKAVFALVFGGVGVGGIIGVFFTRQSSVKEEAEKKLHPDEPWLWKPEWQSGIIKGSSAASMLAIVAFSAVWNAISWPIFILVALDDDPKEWFILPLVGLFPLVGIATAIGGLSLYLRWRRFRGSYLRMASVPGVIGGKLTAVVVIPKPVVPDDGFEVRLICQQVRGSGEDARTVTLFENSQRISRTLQSEDLQETNVPVVFTIPSSASASNDDSDITWKVECKASLPGPDLDLAFEVPVFLTAESQDDITEADADQSVGEFELEESLADVLARQGIRMERGNHPDETVFRSPPGRHLGTSCSLTIFATIWTGICVGLWWNGLWFFASVFTFFDILILPAAFSLWLSTCVLTIRRNRWQVRSGWWPFLWSRVEFQSEDIHSIDKNSNFASNDHKWYSIRVRVKGKKKPVTVANQLTDRRVERLFMAELRERAGLNNTDSDNDEDSPLDLGKQL